MCIIILQGNFTINDAYTLLPFSNTMVNIVMTGEQIKNVLEDAIDFYLDPSGSWGAYPRASGLRFDVDEGQEKGSRVTNLEVNPKLAAEWESIDVSTSYTVVTNNFIATPRDGYYEFGNIGEELKVDTYLEYAQSFIEYAKSVESLHSVDPNLASTQTWIGAATEALTTTMPITEAPISVPTITESPTENPKEEAEGEEMTTKMPITQAPISVPTIAESPAENPKEETEGEELSESASGAVLRLGLATGRLAVAVSAALVL